jgi:hypothetical protein
MTRCRDDRREGYYSCCYDRVTPLCERRSCQEHHQGDCETDQKDAPSLLVQTGRLCGGEGGSGPDGGAQLAALHMH